MLRTKKYRNLREYQDAVASYLVAAFERPDLKHRVKLKGGSHRKSATIRADGILINARCDLRFEEEYELNSDGTILSLQYSFGFTLADLHCRYEKDARRASLAHPLYHLHIEPDAHGIRFPTHEIDFSEFIDLIVYQVER